jgi:hypothetical protein
MKISLVQHPQQPTNFHCFSSGNVSGGAGAVECGGIAKLQLWRLFKWRGAAAGADENHICYDSV